MTGKIFPSGEEAAAKKGRRAEGRRGSVVIDNDKAQQFALETYKRHTLDSTEHLGSEVRVALANMEPFVINSKDTLGRILFGLKVAGVLFQLLRYPTGIFVSYVFPLIGAVVSFFSSECA